MGGVTIEGLQEYHDEACLAVQNNKFNGDGVAWHDVACHFRSVIVCEDSQQLMDLVKSNDGEDVAEVTEEAEKDRKVDLEAILANEVSPPVPNIPTQPPPTRPPPPPPRRLPQRPPRPNNIFGFGGRPKPRPARRPSDSWVPWASPRLGSPSSSKQTVLHLLRRIVVPRQQPLVFPSRPVIIYSSSTNSIC